MTTIGTCDQCVHWKLTGVSQLGSCNCPRFLVGYHHKDVYVLPDGVLVEGDEGWGFKTAPKFGCVHYVAAPPKQRKEQGTP